MIVLLNPQKKTQQLQGELKIIYEYKLKKKDTASSIMLLI